MLQKISSLLVSCTLSFTSCQVSGVFSVRASLFNFFLLKEYYLVLSNLLSLKFIQNHCTPLVYNGIFYEVFCFDLVLLKYLLSQYLK